MSCQSASAWLCTALRFVVVFGVSYEFSELVGILNREVLFKFPINRATNLLNFGALLAASGWFVNRSKNREFTTDSFATSNFWPPSILQYPVTLDLIRVSSLNVHFSRKFKNLVSCFSSFGIILIAAICCLVISILCSSSVSPFFKNSCYKHFRHLFVSSSP
jgi:hypothetical protein